MRRCVITTLLLLLSATGARAQGTDAMLDSVEHRAFNYFWNEANPSNGLIRDRSQPSSPCSIASTGFGLSAIAVGIDRGWISRSNGTDRVLATLQTFWNGPQGTGTSGTIGYAGLYYHWLDMTTATRTWDSELSTIDTGLLFAGILDAKQYFTGSDPRELQIRQLADSIYYRADWNFMRNGNQGILMGWKPGGTAFSGFGEWIGYNEAMILYLEALGSPTHAVPANAWARWTSGYNWHTYFTYSYVTFPPLFGHQYSHCWVDFRNKPDAYMLGQGSDYFENSRRASMVQQAYCKLNPLLWNGYCDSLWGITASDDQSGYVAHGVPPAQSENGTISPTAATSSVAFAPTASIPAIRNMYNNYPGLWGAYGFKDAFNLTKGWYDTDFLGIDQGPIVLMIENYRSGSVWSRFMKNGNIRNGMIAAGFNNVTEVGPGPVSLTGTPALFQNYPNPFRGTAVVRYSLPRDAHVRLRVFDMTGRLLRTLVDGAELAGPHQAAFAAGDLPSGVYQYRLEAGGASLVRKCIVVR